MSRNLKGLILMLFLVVCLPSLAQADSCSKPKVAVIFDEIVYEEEFFDHVNSQYPSQPGSSWLYQIEEKVLEELQMNSPGTEFIPVHGAIPPDCDYYFEYRLTLISAGEDIMWAGALLGEYTAYWMSSELASTDACGIHNRILDIEITKDDEDLNHTIERNIAAWGDIGDRIEKYEDSHPVPPRGPTMAVTPSRDYVSPLKEERKLDLGIKISNCRGENVYDKFHGQWVLLPNKTERGELKPTPRFPQECRNIGNALTLIIVRPAGASATYTIRKGLSADRENINIITCGRDKKITKDKKIEIRGLEITVTPQRRTTQPGQDTTVDIHFVRTSTQGGKDPIGGKKIQIKIKGLVDGKVSPTGEVDTDQDGKTTLTYHAGDKDERITFSASYQPEGYPESVKGTSVITVSKKVYDLVAQVSAQVTWERKNENTQTTGNASYTISGTMKMKTDPGVMRVNPTHMAFEPQDLQLQYTIREKRIDLIPDKGCSELIYELSGGDTVRLPQIKGGPHHLNIQNFGTAAKKFPNVQMPGFLMNYFDFLMEGDMAVLKGQKREGSYCGKDRCPCQDYRDYTVKRTLGATGIRAYIGENGSMSGNLSWEEDGIPRHIVIKVNQMTSRTKKGQEEGTTRYSVQWNFHRVERSQ